MRVLIVDDEAPARRRLARMLERIEGVTVAGEAEDADEARERVRASRPDVVLLDIHMPQEDGLSLAMWSELPPVIFVTAHDEHAVAAFELAAVDYLLKPVAMPRLQAALTRARERQASVDPAALAQALRAAMPDATSTAVPRITARDGSTLHVFDARALSRLSARDKYCVFDRDGIEYVLDDTLSALERRLAPHDFLRVHRGELVNLAHVVALHGTDAGAHVELSDGAKVPVSRRLLPEVRKRLGA